MPLNDIVPIMVFRGLVVKLYLNLQWCNHDIYFRTIIGLFAPLKRLLCCAGKNHVSKETEEKRMSSLKQELQMDEHIVSLDELYDRYDVNHLKGLTNTEAKERQVLYGPNCLTPPKKIPEWKKFCRQLFGGFSLLLWFGSVLCFTAYLITYATHEDASMDNLYLGLVLAAVVIISGCFSYYQVSLKLKVFF